MSKGSGARVRRERRHARVRTKLAGTALMPRLCVFRSLKHIYAQVIDDSMGHTLTSASTLDLEVRDKTEGRTKQGKAQIVGSLVSQRALERGIEQVVFDRGGYKYHGRVKALAEAARQGGMRF